MASAVAMTSISALDEARASANNVQVQFGLSGIITRYQPTKALISINGRRYILDVKEELSDADLWPGRKINYNVEHSASEKDHIIRVWLDP